MSASQARLTEPMATIAPSASPHDPDVDVIELARRGEKQRALTLLLVRHGRAVHRYCLAALRDAALADDVHQQVFIEAFRNLERFDGRSMLRTWLLGIARHRMLDAERQRRCMRYGLYEAGIDAVQDTLPSAVESLDDQRLHQALHVCIAELPEPTRTALLLHYQQGLTFEEMAKICAQKPGTLQARVKRAIPRLRSAIEAFLANPGADGQRALDGRVERA